MISDKYNKVGTLIDQADAAAKAGRRADARRLLRLAEKELAAANP